jgi:hypothetical protein
MGDSKIAHSFSPCPSRPLLGWLKASITVFFSSDLTLELEQNQVFRNPDEPFDPLDYLEFLSIDLWTVKGLLNLCINSQYFVSIRGE